MPATPAPRLPNAAPQTGLEARLAIRSGEWTGPTSGVAPGYVQGNLAILPQSLAGCFRVCRPGELSHMQLPSRRLWSWNCGHGQRLVAPVRRRRRGR